MSEDTTFLPAGPVVGLDEVYVIAGLARVGDGLVYSARQGEQARPLRLREYAPRGIVRRGEDQVLELVEPENEEAWAEGRRRFDEQARHLLDLSRGAVIDIGNGREAHPLPTVWSAASGFIATSPPGGSIAMALERGEVFAPARVTALAHQMAAALNIVHAAGLTHLALSPDTVSFDRDAVQLFDFAVDFRPYILLLRSSEGFVQRGYGAVELFDASAQAPLPPAADIYAANAILYRLMTGSEPASWADRRRDIAAGLSACAADYDPAFLNTVRIGLALEPEDRHHDGRAWLAALEAARTGTVIVPVRLDKPTGTPAPMGPAIPPPGFDPIPDAPPPPVNLPVTADQAAKIRRNSWLVPASVGLLLGGSAVALSVVALSDRIWPDTNNMVAPVPMPLPTPTPPPPPPPPPPPAEPDIALGGEVNGNLARTDTRRDDRQYEDAYRFTGRRGQDVEINLSSDDFDTVLRVIGPNGEQEENDDVDFPTDRNSRLRLTLPADGVYRILVSSYPPEDASEPQSATGRYRLAVRDPSITTEVAPPASPAAGLAGRWRLASDPQCRDPQVIQTTSNGFTASFGRQRFTHRISAAEEGEISTTITDSSLAGRSYRYRIGDGGNSFTVEGETWLRCG